MTHIMKQIIRRLAIIALAAVITVPSYAWGKRVHAAIAHIAEQHLTPKAKKTVDQILEGKTMAYYASWPDYYRNEMKVEVTDANGVKSMKGIPHTFKTDENRVPLRIHRGEALHFICESIETLEDWKNVDDSTRLAAMQLLIHLVGDIHCPAHYKIHDGTGIGGYYGKFDVTYWNQKTNMHAVWDDKIANNLSYGGVLDLVAMTRKPSRKEIKELQKGDPYEWGEDIIKRTISVWEINEGDKLGKEFDHKVSTVAFEQILIGGLRLAKVMNDLFD